MLNTDKDAILRGLFDGTKDLKPIFITGGTESGIMKYVGEARAKYNPTAVNTPAHSHALVLALTPSIALNLSLPLQFSVPPSLCRSRLLDASLALPPALRDILQAAARIVSELMLPFRPVPPFAPCPRACARSL